MILNPPPVAARTSKTDEPQDGQAHHASGPNGVTPPPTVLLTDTNRWATPTRLAIGLSRAGCIVSAVCSPQGHPLSKTRVVRETFPYSGLRPLESLTAAIEATNPQIILPCDDRGVEHLHELHGRATRLGASGIDLARLIERSLGPPESYPIVSARYDLLRLAREEGLRVPDTSPINSMQDLQSWRESHPLPWALKADGTFGGRGVRIAKTPKQAEEFFSEITRMFGARRAIKRLVLNRDAFWLRPWWHNARPAVVAQAYVQGHPANCGVVCWQGKVLAGIGVEVVSAEGLTGPASVVRVVDNAEMMLAAERIAKRLGLSGFFGLDFIIEDATGYAYLIEMNPRCTPLCHLQLGKGRDMVSALYAQLMGQPIRETPAVTKNDLIAYFPQAWTCASEYLKSSFHDVPKGEPDLLDELLQPWPDRSLMYRIGNRVLKKNQ
jgi:hypothetical protein